MRLLPAIAFIALLPATGAVAQTVALAPFRAVEVHGGGDVILRHGNSQRVTLLKGDPKTAEIRVSGDGTLELSPCARAMGCFWQHEDFKVEVVTPAIAAISVYGGGELRAKGPFPSQPQLAVEVHGGGEADLRAIPAEKVEASVHGGGEARVRAERQLIANVHGGGNLRYWGHPSIRSQVHGGGSISRGN